jgi:arylsulfatase A-like enzyme
VPRYAGYDLIFISFDALQASHVGAWGGRSGVTPTLDALAARSCVFQNACSVASWTVPASMSWFTGVYPSEHRMTNKFALYNADVQRPADLRELSPQLATLAGLLKQQGYATGGFTGNAGVHGGFGFEAGFDVYYSEAGRFGGFEGSIPRALEWLQAQRDRKFFLFLHGYDCHGQFSPGEPLDQRFVDPAYDRRYTGSPREQELLREEGLDQGRLNLRDADVDFWRAVYDEKVQRADARLGDFLAECESLGIMDRTLLVVTSDHGTELCEHDRLDHGFTLYDELLHVPLIVTLPGQSAAQPIADRVSSIDLLPTLLDLLSVPAGPAQKQLRGTSLVPSLEGQRVTRTCFAETDYREYTYKRAILRPDGHKLILTLESGERELYDLASDPGERVNLAEAQPALADELEAELRAHFRALGHPLEERSWKPGLNPVYPSQGNR